jgi:RimJ/RimL family protein N-acetyltransferase
MPVESIRTPRLVIRCWQRRDAPMLKAAIDASLPELQAWLPWALNEPSPLADIERRLTAARNQFVTGQDWLFGLFDRPETRVVGAVGLHPRVGPGALEIGYWLRTDASGQGFMTEAVQAVCDAGFARTGVERIEIRCDPNNTRSAAIPRRLGFALTDVRHGNGVTTRGEPRDTLIWTMQRADWPARLPRAARL